MKAEDDTTDSEQPKKTNHNGHNGNHTKKTADTAKVFDVMRPGKAPAPPTSRPGILSHKPEVQDTVQSVSGLGESRPLMSNKNRIKLAPLGGEDSNSSLAASAAGHDHGGVDGEAGRAQFPERRLSHNGSAVKPLTMTADKSEEDSAEAAAVPTMTSDVPEPKADLSSDTPAKDEASTKDETEVEKSIKESESKPEPKPEPAPEANKEPEDEYEPEETREATPSPAAPEPTSPAEAGKRKAVEGASVASDIPETHTDTATPEEAPTDGTAADSPVQTALSGQGKKAEPQAELRTQEVFVSQHGGNHAVKVVLLVVVVVILALVALDIVLDAGLLNVSGIPHTNLF